MDLQGSGTEAHHLITLSLHVSAYKMKIQHLHVRLDRLLLENMKQ